MPNIKRLASSLWLRWFALASLALGGGFFIPGLRAQTQVADQCPLGQGYWKSHPESWPRRSLVLGNPSNPNHTYTQGELLARLQSAVKGDASIILAHQLIAAKLNIFNGANAAPISSVLGQADALLGLFSGKLPYRVNPSTPRGKSMTAAALALENYNSGKLADSCGSENIPPLANAGSDQTGFVNDTITLDGSASSDPDGDPLTYKWTFVSRPQGSQTTLSDAMSVKPTFKIDKPGQYEIRLIVNDGAGDSAPDTVVVSTRNSRPVADAGPDQTVRVNSRVALDGRASVDVDGDTLTFRWRFLGKPEGSNAALDNASSAQPGFIADKAGSYTLELVVNDGKLDSAPDIVIINTENSKPVADAGADQDLQTGATANLNGSASSDADGDPLNYFWSFTSKPAGSTAELSDRFAANPTFAADLEGLYIVQLIVNDGKVDSDADTVNITAASGNRPPVANNDTALTALNTPITVTVLGNDSDPDGDPLTIQSITQGSKGSVKNNNTTVTYTPNNNFNGTDSFTYTLSDGQGHNATATVNVTVDQAPQVNAGADQIITLPANASLTGTVTDDGLPTPVNVTQSWSKVSGPGTVNFANANATSTSASFSQAGTYILKLTANDGFLQNSDDVQITVNEAGNQDPVTQNDFGSTPPGTAVQINVLSNDSDPDGNTLIVVSFSQGSNGVVTCLSNGTCTYTPNPGFSGQDSFTYTASDGQGGQKTGQVTVNVTAADTAVNAPPLNLSAVTTIGKATSFLYSGTNPVQTGVAPGTIDEKRAAVIRGKVTTREGNILQGVTVSILNHPAFGQTLTRSNGYFDLAVNGGGLLTINYQKAGFLSIQRQLKVPWQDYVVAPDVVLIPLDTQVTTITANAGVMQFHQGSTITDSDGTRRATILFPAGTGASLVLPDGSLQSVNTLNVRATEYTVGPNGPKSMPAALPPTSAYTYALELSADESVAKVAGRDIVFSQPVPVYVENFLGFPVGEIVPVGYYDRDKAAWLPSESGRVIKITGLSSGLAVVDTVGTGSLPPLVLDNAERQNLAVLYSVGQELWRTPVPHFSTWDKNWGFSPPPDAEPPDSPQPNPNNPEPVSCEQNSSIVECQSQVLGERLPIVGTRYSLNYRSDRVSGRTDMATMKIQLSGASLPASLRRIELEISIAGQLVTSQFAPLPNQTFTFNWDGRDAYGRVVQGAHLASISIHYVYGVVYERVPQFGYTGNGLIFTGTRGREELKISQKWQIHLRKWDSLPLGLGGWTISPQHVYDSVGKLLYRGDGQKYRIGGSVDINVINTVAGGHNPFSPPGGDGGPATQAGLFGARGIAPAPDGGFFIAESSGNRIRRVRADDIIETVAGLGVGNPGFSGDGGPATQAKLNVPEDVAIGSDGSLYIADTGNSRIRRVRPDGIIETVAGNGLIGSTGDNGPATQARIWRPRAIAIAPDGTLYIADSESQRVRRVGPDGIITTVAGNGTGCFPDTAPCGDDGLATAANLRAPAGLAVGNDGSLYIAAFLRVRRVTPDGIISTVAGTGTPCGPLGTETCGDGGPAVSANLAAAFGLTIAPDGTLYIATQGRLRRVNPLGIISTAASTGVFGSCLGLNGSGFNGDGGPATRANFCDGFGVAIEPNGNLLIGDNDAVRRVGPAHPGFTAADVAIPSEDGSELYQFNSVGRHLRTHNTLTGAITHSFTYDAAGRIATITDGDGNLTTVERDGSGNVTGILSPFTQRTVLNLDSNGYLASATNPAKETTSMAYTADGLLTAFTNPRGFSSQIAYDALGRLSKDQNAAGGFFTLNRSENSQGYTVALTSGLGRTTNYHVQTEANGSQSRVSVFPDNSQTQSLIQTNATTATTTADGTTFLTTATPDPRWGMQAPLAGSGKTTTSGGLVLQQSEASSVTLANPADPLSLQTLSDALVINGRTYTSTYDGSSRTITFTTPVGRLATQEIDIQGRPKTFAEAGISPLQVAYDNRGRLSSVAQSDGVETRTLILSYNQQGFLASITDPLGRVLSYAYDGAGRLTHKTLPDNRVIQYGYDSNGNTTSITPAGKPPHQFSYSQVDQTAEYTPPNVGAGTNSTTYSYDLDKALTASGRPDGQQLQYSYDSAGKISSIVLQPTNVTLASYTYNASTGKLSGIASNDGVQLAYEYDSALQTAANWTGPIAGAVAMTYDPDFRLSSITVNGANPIGLSYDGDNFLVQTGALVLNRDGQNGLLTGTTLGNVADTYTYNGFGELTNYVAAFSGTPVFSQQFSRDQIGRTTTKTETVNGITTAYNYGYDLAGRLIEVKTNNVVTSTYTYDSNDNRLTGPGLSTSPTYDDQDRLLTYGANSYGYTVNGELATKTVGSAATTYTYDVLGNLKSVGLSGGAVIDYIVDGQNRRVGKKLNGTLVQGFLYQDQLKPIAELDGSNNVIARFVYGMRVNVPDYIVKSGATYRIIADQVGSVRLVVNTTTGNIVQRLDYDEFGNVLIDTNPGFQPFGFAGGLYDFQTRLTRFGSRDYDAQIGRWTAKDPIRLDGGLNLYAYVENDPINLRDPAGTNGFTPDRLRLPPQIAARIEELARMSVPERVRAIEELVRSGQLTPGLKNALRNAIERFIKNGGLNGCQLFLILPLIEEKLKDIMCRTRGEEYSPSTNQCVPFVT